MIMKIKSISSISFGRKHIDGPEQGKETKFRAHKHTKLRKAHKPVQAPIPPVPPEEAGTKLDTIA